MVYLYRLIVTCFAFWASVVLAAVPTITEYKMYPYPPGDTWYPSAEEACGAYASYRTANDNTFDVEMVRIGPGGGYCTIKLTQRGRDYSQQTDIPINSRSGACPANSSNVGGQCTCNSGFKESGSQCVPDKPPSACEQVAGIATSDNWGDFGVKSAQWAAGQVGQPGKSCAESGCQIGGTISSCVIGDTASCHITNATYTGQSCETSVKAGAGNETGDPGGNPNPDPNKCPDGYEPSKYVDGVCVPKETGCPAGYEPSAYVAGVCIPKPNNCPAGSSPSQYVEGICIPNKNPDGSDKDSDGMCEDPKDPTKRAPCEGKKSNCPAGQVASTTQVGGCVPGQGGSGKDGNGNNVQCNMGICVTTKPNGDKETESKDAFCSKNPTSDQCKNESKDEFCKKNPNAEQCKDKKSTFGGQCGGAFTCEGDAIACAIAKQQHQRACEFFDDKNEFYQLFQTNKNKEGNITKDLPGNREENIFEKISGASDDFLGGGGSCPADKNIDFGFGRVVIPYSEICPYLEMMGRILVALAGLSGALIIIRRNS